MKPFPKILPFLLASIHLSSLGAGEVATKWNVVIPDPLPAILRTDPPPKTTDDDFRIISSRTRFVDVSKAPELPGLPPVTGTIRIDVLLVEDPNLPDPPPRLPALQSDDPVVIAKLAELTARMRDTELVFLSATVYDHHRTFLQIYPNGRVDDAISAWSNLDFNHFTGFSSFRVIDGVDGGYHDYAILMGVGTMDTRRWAEFAAAKGVEFKLPDMPELPDLSETGPAFILEKGNPGSAAMATLEQLHDLYRTEGHRMAAASRAREKALAERRAYLLANPPVPEDVTIRIWERDVPATHPRKKTAP